MIITRMFLIRFLVFPLPENFYAITLVSILRIVLSVATFVLASLSEKPPLDSARGTITCRNPPNTKI